jgi:hypothetical protein
MLFKGNFEEFSRDCQLAAQDPAVLEEIKATHHRRATEGLAYMEQAKLNKDTYQAVIQGTNEREAGAQALDTGYQADALEIMREVALSPACDTAAYAESLDRKRKHIEFLRNSVAFGRRYEIPRLRVEVRKQEAGGAEAAADLGYLDAVLAGAQSIQASMQLTEMEGIYIFAPEGSRTAQMYEAARSAYKTAVVAREAEHSARKYAEQLAQGGVQ